MAKLHREGQGWAVRLRVADQDIYLSGFATEAALYANPCRTKTGEQLHLKAEHPLPPCTPKSRP